MTIIIDKKEKIEVIYVRLDKLNQWSKNPKLHDIGKIVRSISQNGFQDPGKLTKALEDKEVLLFGNGRAEAVVWMFKQNYDKPKGIGVDDSDGMWCLPVTFGNDFESTEQAEAFALDHNLITIFGGNSTHLDAIRVYDQQKYLNLAKSTIKHSVTADEDDLSLVENLMAGMFVDEQPAKEEVSKGERMPSYNVKFLQEHDKNEFVGLLKRKSDGVMDGEFLLQLLR